MARDLELPVILLSQLNREIEKRSKKIPVLSDLRDSGNIEQDSDIVIFLSREDRDADIDVTIAKNRAGEITNDSNKFQLRFHGEIQLFKELEETSKPYKED